MSLRPLKQTIPLVCPPGETCVHSNDVESAVADDWNLKG
jgi:hypothetical protein